MVTEEHCSVSIKKHLKPGFIHLHNHSEFSILDGMCRIRDLVSRAEKLGMPAVGITDHGNMFGVIEFYESAKEADIKPIIGCEVYYVPDMKVKISRDSYHLTLLVKDLAGYKNLIQITTAGYRDGFYYRPRVGLDLISKHSDGLIALSGCIKGYVPAQIIKGEYPKAEVELGRLRGVFGRDLYVELMDHGLPEQTIANRGLLRLARRLQVPAIATNDCHYIHPSDALAHDTLLCIQTRSKLDDPDRFRFDSDQFYFRTTAEMAALFDREYLSRTMEIAEKCNLKLDLGTSHMPQLTTPDGLTPDEYLWYRIRQGVQERYGGNLDPDREKRLVDEYEIIRETGFSGYFLIVDDLVQHAKQQGIRVGGRGSAVASLVCFTIGITDVDPVEHGLLFQRFIAPGRISPPDIDLDFRHDQRDEVIGYLAEKYGHVAQILTFTRLAPRSIIRDVGRTLSIDQAEIDSAAKSIPKRYLSEEESRPLAELVDEVPELQGLDPRVIDIGTRLHGIVRHTGCHPGGLVVSDRSLTDLVPLCTSRGVELTQFDKDTLETCGLLKIDILGNRFLTVVDMTSRFVEQAYGTRIDDPPADDPETYNMICAGDVSGVFQLGQDYGKGIVEDMQPRSFADLVHTISLGRPGVLALDRYFEARAVGNVQYLYPDLEPILAETYGIIIFQEQVMLIAAHMAGLSWSDADKLRKAIGKKDAVLMASMRQKFLDGCVRRGVSRGIAEELWDQVQYFGGYGFNKAHAAGYATLTYQTAYLKAHYPVEYFASLLSVKGDNADDRREYISEARAVGIEILQPDVNLSTNRCIIMNEAIYLPLTMVDQVGSKACEAILEERAKGKFRSYQDFCDRVPKRTVGKRVKENLIRAGAFDNLHPRDDLMGSVFGDTLTHDGVSLICEIIELPLQSEFEIDGIVGKVYEHIDKRDGLMAFVTIEDNTDRLEVIIFADQYYYPIEPGNRIQLSARLEQHDPLKAMALDYEILEV